MVWLTSFSIKNFKSLLDFEIELPHESPVVFLIGLNGSGKSTVLQAFDFAGELMRGDVTGWLDKRGWQPSDLVTKIHSSRRKTLIDVALTGALGDRVFEWRAVFNPNPNFLRCTFEQLLISAPGSEDSPTSQPQEQTETKIEINVLVKDNRLFINKQEQEVNFAYLGSILSQLNDKIFIEFPLLSDVCNAISNIHSFDLLSPRNIRNRSRKCKTIGMSGESLAGYISSLNADEQKVIMQKLKYFYPWIHNTQIKGFQFGWKELQIAEKIGRYLDPETEDYHNYILWRRSQHINDGTLRLISIVSAALFQEGITLFDEIENGFNPHIIEKLVDLLYESTSQLIITTHSPEILQYIPKDYVVDSVKLLYRKEDATIGITDFFASEETKQKLKILSPGEVFLDVNLETLSKELGKQPDTVESNS